MFDLKKIQKINDLKILSGDMKFEIKNDTIFSIKQKEFLNDLSNLIFADKRAKNFPDIISFAFWIRRSNLSIIEKKIVNTDLRIGLGLLFHITPTNVPINFCYSFVFGLLTGNSNIIKVPTIEFPQIKIICSNINKLFKLNKYIELKKRNLFIRYKSENHEISQFLSKNSDGRVIWGGDKSIFNIKKYETKVDNIDLVFKNKYSFCIINAIEILKLNELDRLLKLFYDDTYTLDQNACSSPHLIIWKGKKIDVINAKKIFWKKFNELADKKYLIDKKNSVDKYLKFCSDAINLNYLDTYVEYNNIVNRLELKKLPNEISSLKGLFGYFYEFRCFKLNEINKIIDSKIQTITYFGFKKKELIKFFHEVSGNGVNRIVPIGKALDMGFTWDGYNIEKKLTKVIDII